MHISGDVEGTEVTASSFLTVSAAIFLSFECVFWKILRKRERHSDDLSKGALL